MAAASFSGKDDSMESEEQQELSPTAELVVTGVGRQPEGARQRRKTLVKKVKSKNQ